MKKETATFAMGCFWHPDQVLRQVPGVLDLAVGYTGGTKEHPMYEEVCTGTTGHAEAVEVTYDPKKVSYEKLLDIFWKNHNPTTHNRQGPDVGAQYRSAIFFHTPEQEQIARKSKAEAEKNRPWLIRQRRTPDHPPVADDLGGDPIVTEIIPASTFWRAEEYHQHYLAKKETGARQF